MSNFQKHKKTNVFFFKFGFASLDLDCFSIQVLRDREYSFRTILSPTIPFSGLMPWRRHVMLRTLLSKCNNQDTFVSK